jgi:inward rectifier potassium channel
MAESQLVSPTERADSDLGFGSVVAARSRTRLLNANGSFNVVRRGLGWRATLALYYRLLTLSWPRFVALLLLLFLLFNAGFAVAYLLCGPGAIRGGTPDGPPATRFAEAFFFSVHTFATVGYGALTPGNLAANLVMTGESFVGLLAVALATGLAFARFSRPRADILYSRQAVVAPYRGLAGFMFRVANRRPNQIVELHARVVLSALAAAGDGRREFHELALERERVSFFPLAWTIVHPIDAASPLAGWTESELEGRDAEFLILLTGFDETFSQTVHSRSSYKSGDVAWNARFASLFEPQEPNAPLAIDLVRLHDVEPMGAVVNG